MNMVSSPDLRIIDKKQAIRNLRRLGIDNYNLLKNITQELQDQMLDEDPQKRNWKLFQALMERAGKQVSNKDNRVEFSSETPNLILFSIIFAAPRDKRGVP